MMLWNFSTLLFFVVDNILAWRRGKCIDVPGMITQEADSRVVIVQALYRLCRVWPTFHIHCQMAMMTSPEDLRVAPHRQIVCWTIVGKICVPTHSQSLHYQSSRCTQQRAPCAGITKGWGRLTPGNLSFGRQIVVNQVLLSNDAAPLILICVS
jgi:hypothetical protein